MEKKHNPNTISLTIKTYDQNSEVENKKTLANNETVYAIIVAGRKDVNIDEHTDMTSVNLSTIAGGKDIPLFMKSPIIASGITDIVRRTTSNKALQGFCLHEIADALERRAQAIQKNLTDKEKAECFDVVAREYTEAAIKTAMKGGNRNE